MKKLLFAAITVGLFAACDNTTEESNPLHTTNNNEIGISGYISTVTQQTRTKITGSTAVWQDGDTIGVFCPEAKGTGTNNMFTVSNTSSTASWATTTPMYWADASTFHKFVAYYPYASGTPALTAIPLPSLTGQTGDMVDPSKDFLYSKDQWSTGVKRNASAIPLTFTHALTLIEFDITINNSIASGTTLSSLALASPTSSDKLYTSDATSSTIDISSGAITAGTTTNTLTLTPGTPPALSSTAKAVYALILPGTFTTAPTITINMSEGGTALAIPATSLVTKTFAAGSKYVYTVSISRSAITISAPSITDWSVVNGGNLNPSII